jgi:cytochrome c oxidase accessory protein FixG
VCPTGIDIRKGLQYECIGCAACIDGCNQVMDKMGYPQGLIRYTTENALAQHFEPSAIWKRVFRARTLIYLGLLVVVTATAGVSLYTRNPLRVDVIRDRGSLSREADNGMIENVYRLQIINTDETRRRYTIAAEGIPGLAVVGVEQPVTVEAATTRLVPLRLQAPPQSAQASGDKRDDAHAKTQHIEIVVQAVDEARVMRREKSSFVFPR